MNQRDPHIDKMSGLAAWFTWLLVGVLPIALGLLVRAWRPSWSPLVAVLLGAAAVILSFLLAEGMWRGLRCLFTWGQSEQLANSPPTPRERAALLLADVLADRRIRFSKVTNVWPSSNDPVIADARAILDQCADARTDRFTQSALNDRLKDLNRILNRLRSE